MAFRFLVLLCIINIPHEVQGDEHKNVNDCSLSIREEIKDFGSSVHHRRRHVRSNIRNRFCENAEIVNIEFINNDVKRSFNRKSTKSRQGRHNDNFLGSSYASWIGEDATDGSTFHYIQDIDGNMAGSFVDLTNHNVVQLQTQGSSVVATITASNDFPPEKDPLQDRKTKNMSKPLSTRKPVIDNSTTTSETHKSNISYRKLYDDNGGNLDVMIIWTAWSECAASGLPQFCTLTVETESTMHALISLAISETNEAYVASGVNTELLLVHAYRHPDYIESSFETSLGELQAGDISNVHTNREVYGADLVALILAIDNYCGYAYIGPDVNNMFSTTSWRCATGYYSFGHEIGHNLGLRHDRGAENACNFDGYNYGFRDPNANFRTVMAYNCETGECDNNAGGGCTRIARYSNQYSLYNGLSLGSPKEDSARAINEVRAEVAGYYQHAETVTLACDGDEIEVFVTVLTDNHPDENSWVIRASSGARIASSELFTNPWTTYRNQFCLPASACYTFTFIDTYNDGLLGNGHFTLKLNGVLVLQDSDQIFSSLTTNLGLCSKSCTDSTFQFRLKKDKKIISRGCDWVNKDTDKRCALPGVSGMCQSTCDTCNSCTDGINRFRFLWNGKMITRDCVWVANKQTNMRCAVNGISSTCRKTCGSC